MDEKLSALMDGELDAHESARMLAGYKGNQDAKGAWNTYHLIGDVMRGETRMHDMSATIARRLADEPTVLAPRRTSRGFVGRHAMPLAASVAAIGFVGVAAWQLIHSNVPGNAPAQIAQAQIPAAPATTARVENTPTHNRPVQVPSSYLLAHQEFSPTYAVETTPMLARTVSLQREEAAR